MNKFIIFAMLLLFVSTRAYVWFDDSYSDLSDCDDNCPGDCDLDTDSNNWDCKASHYYSYCNADMDSCNNNINCENSSCDLQGSIWCCN
mmetsp:Transcript_638/g.571  ORF Transcript_638/g.571 Transcript_638/m.571 type:complete len:89 (+) Transcript_638:87-353(+)